jgi:hypothetical protein
VDDDLFARMNMQGRRLHTVVGHKAVKGIAVLIDARLVGEVDLEFSSAAKQILRFHDRAAGTIAGTIFTESEDRADGESQNEKQKPTTNGCRHGKFSTASRLGGGVTGVLLEDDKTVTEQHVGKQMKSAAQKKIPCGGTKIHGRKFDAEN